MNEPLPLNQESAEEALNALPDGPTKWLAEMAYAKAKIPFAKSMNAESGTRPPRPVSDVDFAFLAGVLIDTFGRPDAIARIASGEDPKVVFGWDFD